MAPIANKIEKMPKNLLSLYWIISKRVHRLVASPLVSSGWDGSGLEKSLKLTKDNNKASLKKTPFNPVVPKIFQTKKTSI